MTGKLEVGSTVGRWQREMCERRMMGLPPSIRRSTTRTCRRRQCAEDRAVEVRYGTATNTTMRSHFSQVVVTLRKHHHINIDTPCGYYFYSLFNYYHGASPGSNQLLRNIDRNKRCP